MLNGFTQKQFSLHSRQNLPAFSFFQIITGQAQWFNVASSCMRRAYHVDDAKFDNLQSFMNSRKSNMHRKCSGALDITGAYPHSTTLTNSVNKHLVYLAMYS